MVWSVAYSQPSQEKRAVEHVARLGLETFFPQIQERKYKNGKRVWEVSPLFPRYFFVWLADEWHFLLSTIGVSGVIMSGDKPATLPVVVVDTIRQRCNRNGIYVPDRFRFTCGQGVRVVRGVLQGHLGIYQGMRSEERSDVLIQMLGSLVHASVLEGDLIEGE